MSISATAQQTIQNPSNIITEKLKIWFMPFVGIRMILFVSLFVISAIPISLLSIWVERSAVDKEIAAVSEKHLLVAQNLSSALSRYAIDVKLLFDFFVEEKGSYPTFADNHNLLQNLHLKYIVTLDATGKIIQEIKSSSVNEIMIPNTDLLNILRKEARLSKGITIISGIKKFLGSPYLFVLKSLPHGKISIAPLAPTYLLNVQKAIAFGDRGHSMIVDHQGKVIAHPNSQWQQSMKDASRLSIVNKMIMRNTGVMTFYSPPMKADMIAGYTFVPETGWGVMVPQPMSELINRAHDVQFKVLVISIILILVVFLFSLTISKLLARPVLAVADAAQKLTNGQFDVHVEQMPAYVPSEMHLMADTFNNMIDELQFKTYEISKALIKAEDGSRTKSQFLAMMSHEIRTPMNGVLGILELLDDTALDTEQKKYISVARNSGNSLIQVINDILDFSQLEAGKLEINNEPFDINNTVDEVIDLFRPIADQKSIGLQSIQSENMPEVLIADAQRIRQVLFNLLGNAVKFSHEGGVTIQSFYSSNAKEMGTLKIIVTDTGIGIPVDMHDKLFEDFAQCDASYSRRFGGTGLGLSISMRLINLMMGDIGFNSTPDQGSTFWITIPVIKGA